MVSNISKELYTAVGWKSKCGASATRRRASGNLKYTHTLKILVFVYSQAIRETNYLPNVDYFTHTKNNSNSSFYRKRLKPSQTHTKILLFFETFSLSEVRKKRKLNSDSLRFSHRSSQRVLCDSLIAVNIKCLACLSCLFLYIYQQ